VQDEIDDATLKGDVKITTTITRFLKYENPLIYALRGHRYVAEAICTGQTCGLLPSISKADEMLASTNCTPSQLWSNLQSQFNSTVTSNFNLPDVVLVDIQRPLHKSIKATLGIKRKASEDAGRSCADWDQDQVSMEGVSYGPDGALSDNRNVGLWLKTVPEVVERVKKKHRLDDLQSTCYYFMVDRLILSLHRLPATAKTRALHQQKFLYMGGAGGTGKSLRLSWNASNDWNVG
jgi:hypothetical protein